MKRANKLALLFVVLLLVGCATPSVTTPKPDIRPIQASHEKAKASVGKTKEYVGQLRASQARASEDLKRAIQSLNRYTGTDTAIAQAKQELSLLEKEFIQSQEYASWASRELENAWAYEAQVSTQLVTLGRDIEQAHKNEQALADWKAKNEPVIKEVNKWFGLGAIIYGVKKLLKWAIFGTLILAVIGVALFFFAPGALVVIRKVFGVATSFIGRIFKR